LETSHALRQTSDALMRDLDVLAAIEEEKRDLVPGDPRLVELAGRVEEIAERIFAGTVRQHQLSQDVNLQVEHGAEATAIAETRRALSAILADWREAERRLTAAEPGSADALEAAALAEALRNEYRRAYDETRRSG
jgi:hypothetical protein